MKAPITLLLFLAALLATGTCLECEVCTGLTKFCKGPMERCGPGMDTCAVGTIETIMGDIRTETFSKRCMPRSACHGDLFIYNLGKAMKIRKSFICCSGSDCVRDPPILPPANDVPNGLQCPACHAIYPNICHNETVLCAGPETRCLEATSSVIEGNGDTELIMKGCTTQAVCSRLEDTGGALGGIKARSSSYECYPASTAGPGPAGLLLPALAGLLLTQLLS
ncbi:phospholipase A2 inhibitor gamma subunit B-like [Alligator mississippiensis]|nr:phospholipase A2 inhibitor gamma subunit B-like [Alligator mississippiensis]